MTLVDSRGRDVPSYTGLSTKLFRPPDTAWERGDTAQNEVVRRQDFSSSAWLPHCAATSNGQKKGVHIVHTLG
jgi:hypothetical protein